MNSAIKLLPEPLRSVSHAVIHAAGPGVYTSISAADPAIDHPARIILLQNFTNADLMISMDGVNDHFPIPNQGFVLLDVTSNKSTTGGIFCIAEGTRFFVKQLEDPTAGSLYLSVFYASEGL
jgi:hypothetical protein